MFNKRTMFTIVLLILIILSINLFNYTTYAAIDTIDKVMGGAQNFIEQGSDASNQINQDTLESTSDFIYNLLLAIAMVVAVIIGMVIGIQFMTASVEEKAKIKESLVPYVVGCVVVFGAFGIWKIAVNVMSNW